MKPYYRIPQRVMTKVTGRMYQEPTLICGAGSLFKVKGLLVDSGVQSVLVVTTPGFIRRETLQPFFESLEEGELNVTIFSDVVPDPTVECVEALAQAYRDGECEAIVAIGGGSVIDCAKVAGALIARPGKTVPQLRGILKVRKELPDFYAVPTTAGTGSEATVAAVVTDTIDGKHYKYAISDFCLVPKYAILDPELTLSLPKDITAATGMDALTHAVEAYTNRFASDLVAENALEAVKLIFEYLPKAYRNGDDIDAREKLLIASYKAGVAFTNNYVGYVHAVAHAVGALYEIPHGKACAMILPQVMDMYGRSVYKELSDLARIAKIHGAKTDKEKAAARTFIQNIRWMNLDMNIPEKILELKEEDFDEIIKRAITEANPAYPVPQEWGPKKFRRLLNALLVKER